MKYIYKNTTVYNLPGGNVEFGESMEQTVHREMIEELGIDIKIIRPMLIAETEIETKGEFILNPIFLCEILKGQPIVNQEHTSAVSADWLTLENLESVNLYPNIAKQLLESLNKTSTQFYSGIKQPWF